MAMTRNSLVSALLAGFLLAITPTLCRSEPFIEILDARAKGDEIWVSTEVATHDGSFLDLNITIHKDFIGHSLFMSVHLKTLVKNQWVSIKRWQNIDVCNFLSGDIQDVLLNYIFENVLGNRPTLACPFYVGFYQIDNIHFDVKRMPPVIPKSTKYRFFLEVSQTMGETVKLLSLKVDAAYHP